MRTKLLVALAAVMALVATSASASHDLKFDFSLDDNSAGANSDVTWSVDYGTNHPDGRRTLHLPPGFAVAHADGSTLVPSPEDGEEVADAEASGEWEALFCGSSSRNHDGHWVEPMDSDAPSGAVAQIEFTGLVLEDDMYVFHRPNGDERFADAHYDLSIPPFGEGACDGSDLSVEITVYGTTTNGNKVLRNPCAEGTYTMYFEYTDQSGNAHSDSDTVDIVGNC